MSSPDWHDDGEPIRLGISACLLGAPVRFDTGHKHDRYLSNILGEHVVWVPVCPELEAGLGAPRPTLELRGGERGDRLRVHSTGEDLTDMMAEFAADRVSELAGMGLDGFVFKKDSPSCGVERVRVYGTPTADERPGDRSARGMAHRTGIGHFARVVAERVPWIPLEEEGRLRDPVLREHFVEFVFCVHRWRVFENRGLSRGGLVAFHEAHKMLILAHDESRYRELGRLVGRFGQEPDEDLYRAYHRIFVEALRERATVARHVNVLEHLFGHLKRVLSDAEKREIRAAIETYRSGLAPLIVPVTLLRFLVASHGVEYVGRQLYLEPHPAELMLRNHA